MRRIIKPKYVDPIVFGGGQQIAFRPPMLFRDVVARAFPLKANIARLGEFVDQYLNADIPDEIVHFTPALPYVYFMSLNYGGMSATTENAQRLGWVAQHEAFFLVPLQRWRREHGKLKFQGWTSVTPFIFVDDPMSMATGREVYGWPKNQSWIGKEPSVWTTHPRAATRLFTMDVDIFQEVYAGEREPSRTLVTIDRDPIASFAEYPLNYKCPWSITSALPNIYATSMSLMEEAADILSNLRLRGFPDVRNSESLLEMGRESLALVENMLAGLSPIPLPQLFGEPLSGTNARAPHVEDLPRYFSSTINLKQFRDPEREDRACYSALVESAMGVDRLNQFGLLGDWDLLRGDTSGGFSIGIARYRAQPIIETLGIEVPPADADAREGDMVKLRPSFPFWMDVDLYYGAGDVICSRMPDLEDGEWIEETAAGPQRQGYPHGRTHRRHAHTNAFNTALGAATLPVFGPLHFPDLTVQVYPLRADPKILKQFLDWYWNRLFEGGEAPAKLELELAGAYVYLTVSTVGDGFGKMWSGTENIGWWAEREASFAIPVRWRSEGKLVGLAMIEPLAFVDKPRAVATDREVNGRNAFKALVESPRDVWTSPGGPGKARRLARVATESFVELGYGLEAKTQTLLEIAEQAGCEERHAPPRADAVEALALEILARGAPLHRLTLKQYRDAADFDRACYQSVVHTQRRVGRIHAIGEMEAPLQVALHRRANFPIVETLGLKAERTESGDSVVDYLTPVRPFWMRVDMTEDLGRVVATVNPHYGPDAAGEPARHWKFKHPPPPPRHPTRAPVVAMPPDYFGGEGATAVGAGLVEALREGAREDLPERVKQLQRRMLVKEIWALRGAALALPDETNARRSEEFARAKLAPDRFGAWLTSASLDGLRGFADALREAMPAWAAPSDRRVRVTELERLAQLAIEMEKMGALAIEDEAARAQAERLLQIFVAPDRETDVALRNADARGLYDNYVVLARALSPTVREPEPTGGAFALDSRFRGHDGVGSIGLEPSPPSGLIARLKRIEQWIVAPPHWRGLVPVAAEQALDRLRLKRFVAEYDFDAERLGLLEVSLEERGRVALRELANMAELGSFQDAQRRGGIDPVGILVDLSEALAGDVDDWAEPRRWLRMTRGEARHAVERLEDLQSVIEAILDDRWGPRAEPARR